MAAKIVVGVTVVALGLVAVVAGVGATVAVVTAASAQSGPGVGEYPISGRLAVPLRWEALDQRAVQAQCPGLSWAVLAAIGRIESDSGRSNAPGVHSGANAAGAEGPMQFEPQTFAAYETVGPGGAVPPSPYDPIDAVYTAATLLCSDGAGQPAGLAGALWDYNHSPVYVNMVLVLATSLTVEPTLAAVPATAIGFAASKIGVPYLWGGTGTGGYDCSGLVQAAYAAAGVSLPRVAQDQFDAGPAVASGSTVAPGDLLFFGASTSIVDHVGIYIGSGEMIDAPYTGVDVRIDSANWPNFVGATRPA
ncbi:MAG: C40 family peptidase [Acidimicrobiales bacterium]|jgi:hypothetical protein